MKVNRAAKQLVAKPCLISPVGTSYYRAKAEDVFVWVLYWERAILRGFGLVGRGGLLDGDGFQDVSGETPSLAPTAAMSSGSCSPGRAGEGLSVCNRCSVERRSFYSGLAVKDKIQTQRQFCVDS